MALNINDWLNETESALKALKRIRNNIENDSAIQLPLEAKVRIINTIESKSH